jgi:ADP-ribosylation factor GTPase-activating protein 1
MSGKMWEVDPETKQKLQEIQKKNGNNACVDCGAPSPQWVSVLTRVKYLCIADETRFFTGVT